jgi:hypothetical protein
LLKLGPGKASIVISFERQEADAAADKPFAQLAHVGSCARAGSRRLDQIARYDQASHRRALENECKSQQGLVERMSDHRIASRPSGPFVAQVEIGNDRDTLDQVNHCPFRSEQPVFKDMVDLFGQVFVVQRLVHGPQSLA